MHVLSTNQIAHILHVRDNINDVMLDCRFNRLNKNQKYVKK